MKQGRLIVFCGIDGCGKTTQIRLLESHLENRQQTTVTLKQPTSWYREHPEVRKRLDKMDSAVDLRFLALFSAADRIKQQNDEVLPALNAGKFVLMDRYVYSAYAYFWARGLSDDDWLRTINRYAIKPDITFYFDIDPKIALERVLKRDESSKKNEEQNIEFMTDVRERFDWLTDTYMLQRVSAENQPMDIANIVAQKVDLLIEELE